MEQKTRPNGNCLYNAGMRNLRPLFVSILLLLSSCSVTENKPPQAAIATAHPLATAAGMEVLKQGGNAFDAAVAITALIGVVEPYGSGIGGGGFWLLQLEKNIATMNNGEPAAFSLGSLSMSGVNSDNYSFWDMSSDDLSAKGNGGLKQMYNYAIPDNDSSIETPPDNYVPDKIGGDVSLDSLTQSREQELSNK